MVYSFKLKELIKLESLFFFDYHCNDRDSSFLKNQNLSGLAKFPGYIQVDEALL